MRSPRTWCWPGAGLPAWTARVVPALWRWPPPATANGQPPPPITNMFEIAEQHGWTTNGRKLAGERIAYQKAKVPIRPLTESEAEQLRVYADRGMRFSRRSVMVALSFAGATAKELIEVRKEDVNPALTDVRLSDRVGPLGTWGQHTLRGFFANNPDLPFDTRVCLRNRIHSSRRLHVINVRLGEALRDAGLNRRPGVTPRSIRLHTALKVFTHTHGLEAAARFLAAASLDKTPKRWATTGKTRDRHQVPREPPVRLHQRHPAGTSHRHKQPPPKTPLPRTPRQKMPTQTQNTKRQRRTDQMVSRPRNRKSGLL